MWCLVCSIDLEDIDRDWNMQDKDGIFTKLMVILKHKFQYFLLLNIHNSENTQDIDNSMDSVSIQNSSFRHQEVDSASITGVQHLYSCCLESFTRLSSLLKTPYTSGAQSLGKRLFSTLLDEMGRFRVWADSTGANQQAGKNSLDYRLQEAPHIHQRMIGLLRELEKDILEVILILKHRQQKPGWSISLEENSSTGSAQEDNDPGASELESILADIGDIISNLYQLSTTIRNPAARARVKELASIDVSQYKDEDFKNVRLKHEMAPLFLVERLARANTKRRQLLIYYERRRLRMMSNISPPRSRDFDKPVKDDGESFKARGATSEVSTQKRERAVSTNLLGDRPPSPLEVDPNSIFAPSGSVENKSDVPGSDFETPSLQMLECPVCAVHPGHRLLWKKHVIKHLKPYICTNEACPTPDRLFDSIDEWYEHEIRCHWREWFCECCSMVVSDRDEFRNHIIHLHPETCIPSIAIGPGERQNILDSVIDRCERQRASNIRCPVCINLECKGDRIKNHLSWHLQGIVGLIFSRSGDVVAKETNKTSAKPGDISEGRLVANNQDVSELSTFNSGYNLAPDCPRTQTSSRSAASQEAKTGSRTAPDIISAFLTKLNKDSHPREFWKIKENERSTTHSPQLQPQSESQKDHQKLPQDSSTHDPMPLIERQYSKHELKLLIEQRRKRLSKRLKLHESAAKQDSGLAPKTLDEKSGSPGEKPPLETKQEDSPPPPEKPT